jgi:hypothetical protein
VSERLDFPVLATPTTTGDLMADVIFVLVTLAFFAVAALVLRGVEKL